MAFVDWIKVEHTTPNKQELFKIAKILKLEPDSVLGKVVRFWIWADQNTEDGNTIVTDLCYIDHVVNFNGFGSALLETGWIERLGENFVIPRFDRHNSESAKKRANTLRRVQKHRSAGNASVTKPTLQKPQKNVTLSSSPSPSVSPLEKEEEKIPITDDEFKKTVDQFETYTEDEFTGKPPAPPQDRQGEPESTYHPIIAEFDDETKEQATAFVVWYQERRFCQPITHTEQYRRDLRSVAGAIRAFKKQKPWEKLAGYMANPPDDHPTDVKIFQILGYLGLVTSLPTQNTQQQDDEAKTMAILKGGKS